jgi:MoxR-like ATPase
MTKPFLFDLYRGDGLPKPGSSAQLPGRSALHAEEGRYLADDTLAEAVNLALCTGQPLLVTGEPGCGKTRLAWGVARELDLEEPLVFSTRSTSRAQDLLYTYDAVRRFNDIQARQGEPEKPEHYIYYQALGQAIVEGKRRVVLVDEIDKAPRDFPNDLLTELDRMEFEVPELKPAPHRMSSPVRPIVIITSNNERELPVPFLRRCVFHLIDFPDTAKLKEVVRERLQKVAGEDDLLDTAVERFERVRAIKGLSRKPATGELIAWFLGLRAQGVSAEVLRQTAIRDTPLWQALLKDRDDRLVLQGTGG